MSNAMLNIFIRTIKRRIENGETLSEILESYTKLSNEDKEQIRNAIEN
jgi:uncharacterized protein (DUF433 family)